MKIQNSFADDTVGKLYIVPTPIGNLEDITYRALNILKTSACIAAEDTRHTQKLLNHFEIRVPLISYHEHNQRMREEGLIDRLRNGEQIALVSDAGMPAISDPGAKLVQAAIDADIPVVVLPGANAALCALVGSGLGTDEFLYYGFLPRKKKERKEELERLLYNKATLLLYESPHRLKETLKALQDVFGHERRISVARELTKRFEEYIRGTIQEIVQWSESVELRGEFVLVIEGSLDEAEQETAWWQELTIAEHVEQVIIELGLSSKDAIKEVATLRDLPKREVYQLYHQNN